MKKAVLSIFIFALPILIQAQNFNFFEATIVDDETNETLYQVNVFNQTSTTGTFSDFDGNFKLKISTLPSKIIFSFIGYENYLLELDSTNFEKIKTIRLRKTNYGLPQVEVTDQPKIEELSRKKYSIKDFLFDGNFELSLHANQIQIFNEYPSKEFEDLIEPCVTSSKNYVYFKKYGFKDQILTYSIFKRENFQLIKKLFVVDELNISRSKDDFVLQRQVPHLKPTWAEIMAWEDLMYQPLYSPLINFEKEFAIFNHTNSYLEFYSMDGVIQRYMPITYHKTRNWSKQILFDHLTKKTYTVYDTKKGKSIYEINLEEGTTEPIMFFNCEFVEKMEIHNGHLFYLESGIKNSERNRILHRIELE